MKLRNILKEVLTEGRSEEKSKEEALDLYRKKCGQFHKNKPRIYRGVYGDSPYMFIEPKLHNRKSANTGNWYTLWIDNEWPNKYPKRSESIICSESYTSAESYGPVYRVIPFDGATIGICPSGDIWNSFTNINKYFHTDTPGFFYGTLGHFLKVHTDGKIDSPSDDSYNALIQDLKTLNALDADDWKRIGNMEGSHIDNTKSWKTFGKFMSIRADKPFLEVIEKLLNSTTNGFEIKNISSYSDGEKGREIWTDSPSLLIRDDHFHSFIRNL